MFKDKIPLLASPLPVSPLSVYNDDDGKF